jgi:GcrA cell cycle regulator
MHSWSAERVEALKMGFHAGHSFAWIAKDLGSGVSRSACIGKAMRLGLVRSGDKAAFHQIASKVGTANRADKAPSRLAARLQAPPVARATAQNNGLNFRGPQVRPAGLKALAVFEAAGEGGVRLFDVERHHCRWPFGDPEQRDFRFCGARKARGSYCAAHAAIAFPAPSEQEAAEVASLERLLRRLA